MHRRAPRTLEDFNRLSVEQLEAELRRSKRNVQFAKYFGGTLCVIVVAAAIAVLLTLILMPVLRIYGVSMTPTLEEDDIVLCVRGAQPKQGDIVAFYLGNKILVKRVIALPGDIVDIDADGNVSVNGQALAEPYVSEREHGLDTIDFPYQVPESRLFCMGDHRRASTDSRYAEVGCVAEDQMVGKLMFRIWPLNKFGFLKQGGG